MEREILLRTKISVDDLVDELAGEDNELIVELIKKLDKSCACYDFTKELRDYFVEEMIEEDKHRC